jgi:hypothetical protein
MRTHLQYQTRGCRSRGGRVRQAGKGQADKNVTLSAMLERAKWVVPRSLVMSVDW